MEKNGKKLEKKIQKKNSKKIEIFFQIGQSVSWTVRTAGETVRGFAYTSPTCSPGPSGAATSSSIGPGRGRSADATAGQRTGLAAAADVTDAEIPVDVFDLFGGFHVADAVRREEVALSPHAAQVCQLWRTGCLFRSF